MVIIFQSLVTFTLGSYVIRLTKTLASWGISRDMAPISATLNLYEQSKTGRGKFKKIQKIVVKQSAAKMCIFFIHIQSLLSSWLLSNKSLMNNFIDRREKTFRSCIKSHAYNYQLILMKYGQEKQLCHFITVSFTLSLSLFQHSIQFNGHIIESG